MAYRFPALNLKAKLIFLMVGLLALTLGAEVIVSLGTQEAIVESTQEKVSDLTRAIQISVQELTSVRPTDPERLRNYIAGLRSKGLEVSIASTQNLIINSSNPKIIGEALQKTSLESGNIVEARNFGDVPPVKLRGSGPDRVPDSDPGRGPSARLCAGGRELRRLREAVGAEPLA